MNYLAHILLSGENHLHLVGNFMGDSIKGKHFEEYEDDIVLGIKLHREIDTFMDSHPVVMKGKHRLHNKVGKYAGVVIDVFYDHFLCLNWERYSKFQRVEFIKSSYHILQQHASIMPKMSQYILGHMITNDWLGHYHKEEGIHRALSGLSKRTKYENNMPEAVEYLRKYKVEFNEEFNIFFPEIMAHSSEFLKNHGKT